MRYVITRLSEAQSDVEIARKAKKRGRITRLVSLPEMGDFDQPMRERVLFRLRSDLSPAWYIALQTLQKSPSWESRRSET